MKPQPMKRRFATIRAVVLTGRLLSLSLLLSACSTARAADAVLGKELQDGLSLWMEASTNVILNSDGSVGEWRDVRETENAAAAECLYARAIHRPDYYDYFDSPAPTLLKGVADCPNRPFVSMGPLFGSGSWMLFVDSAGAATNIYPRSSFAFIKLTSATASVPVGQLLGHTDNSSQYSYNGSQKRWFYTQTLAQGILTNAETRLDGLAVASDSTWPADDGGHLLSQIGPVRSGNPFVANNFGNWLGYFPDQKGKGYTGPKYENGQRIGGPIIGEILVYSRCVTDAERRAVEKYLLTKWMGADIRTDLTAATGDITKSEGTMRVARNSGTYAGVVTLGAGAGLIAEQNAELPPVAVEANRAATVGVGSVAMAEGASDTFAASGTGALTVGSVASDVKRISSAGVTLQMRSQGVFVNPADDMSVVVTNGSFESPVLTKESLTTTPDGWNFTGWNRVIVRDDDTAYHHESYTGPVPEGRQFVALSSKNSASPKNSEIATDVQIAETGVYGVRLYFSARDKNSLNSVYPARVQIDVDGTNIVDHTVGHDLRSVGTDSSVTVVESMKAKFLEYEFPTPTLRPGKHTVTIRSLPINDSCTDACVIILDNVRVVPRKTGDYVWVRDSSFDSWGAVTPYSSGNRYHIDNASPANTAWQFGKYDSSVSSSQAGMTQDGRFWFYEGKTNETTRFADHRKAYLLNASLVSNAVTFAQAGAYVFSMRYSKTDWGVKVGDHSVSMTLRDDAGATVDLGKAWPQTSETRLYTKAITVPHAGTYVLTIKNTDLPSGTAGSDKGRGTIVDDVAFRVGPDGTLTAEDYAGTYSTQTIARDGALDCPVAFGTSGVWRVRVSLKGQALNLETQNGPYHGKNFYPHAFNVLLDGVSVGRLTVDEPETVTYALRLPFAAKGVHTLRFASDSAASANKASSSVTGLVFERLTEEEMPSLDLTDLAFALKDGARLNLDYPGELTVRRLTINGTKASGTVSAATHPSAITGRGSFRIEPKGFGLILR